MAAVCGTSGIASLFSQAAFAAESDIADGQTQRFDFSVLQSMAHDLAQTAWRGAPRPLPDTLATMTPQAYNSIQYDAEKSLWHNVENRQLDAQFFHMGMGFRRRVRMFSVDPATHLAREIHFRPELFKYNDAGVDTKQLEGQSDLGFAGFRVFKARNWRAATWFLSSVPAISVPLMTLINTVYRRVVWRSTLTPTAKKSFPTLPPSGSIR